LDSIKNKEQFLDWINTADNNFRNTTHYQTDDRTLTISDEEFINVDLRNKHFQFVTFVNCHFNNCDFVDTTAFVSNFDKCHFKNCKVVQSKFIETDLTHSQFENCSIFQFELIDVISKKVQFLNCHEILDLEIKGRRENERDYAFINSHVLYLSISSRKKQKLVFSDSIVEKSKFTDVDFSNSKFEKCNLSSNSFINCNLGQNLFSIYNEVPAKEFNYIDIHTILESPTQDEHVLKKIFGISGSEIKEYLYGLVYEIEFQSIFISYSFEDREFAKIINDELLAKGIMTFLWEKDAPGGKKLTDIMSSNVKAKDRVLFIASENSLRSEACQYELSEARKKQEQIWEDVLFPIHIDDYLFEIRKDDIRPLEVQKEYWANIEELKKLNSVDFSDCINPENKKGLFEKKIFDLIKGLRKNA